MTATWHTPATWSVGQLVTATNLNEQLRDNLEFLKAPPTALYNLDQGSDYTTTSTSFVNVDATNLSLTIVTAGGDVLIGFFCAAADASQNVYFDVLIDDTTRLSSNDGLIRIPSNGNMCFVAIKQGLSAGSHNFKLQWKVSGGTGTLYAGAGTGSADLHPQFWVREVS